MNIFLVTFREALEASLIIGLIFSLLQAFGIVKNKRIYIFLGVGLWVCVSIILAWVIIQFFWEFEGRGEQIYEGSLMLLASLMITHFIIWTNSHFSQLWTKIKKSIDRYITSWEIWILTFLAFVSVLREGVETAIFLGALDFKFWNIDILYALWGILTAVIFSYILYTYIKKLNLIHIIQTTNVLFFLIAAGLFAHAIWEFQEAQLLPIFREHLFDISTFLPDSQWFGSFLKASISYNSSPSLLSCVGYMGYIGIVSYILFFKRKNRA